MCTSEPVFLESSAAACAARRASSEPSVARRIFVGKMLIRVTSFLLLRLFPEHHDAMPRSPAHPSKGCSRVAWQKMCTLKSAWEVCELRACGVLRSTDSASWIAGAPSGNRRAGHCNSSGIGAPAQPTAGRREPGHPSSQGPGKCVVLALSSTCAIGRARDRSGCYEHPRKPGGSSRCVLTQGRRLNNMHSGTKGTKLGSKEEYRYGRHDATIKRSRKRATEQIPTRGTVPGSA